MTELATVAPWRPRVVPESAPGELAAFPNDELAPRGVGVVVEAERTCMTLRGVRAAGARTITAALRDSLRDDPAGRAEFPVLARRGRDLR